MNTFFTSDLHFGHKNIIKYCNRPFKTVGEMDEAIIQNWNNKIGPDDLTYVIGDVIFGGSGEMAKVLPRLNGEKILILGNHDEESPLRKHFSAVYRLFDFVSENPKVPFMLCHYPIESWAGMRKGRIHLHGHCHGTLERKMQNRMDVGIDCHPKFEPWSIEEVLNYLKVKL